MENVSNKNLTWQEYEAITKYIYEMLGAKYGIKVISYAKELIYRLHYLIN